MSVNEHMPKVDFKKDKVKNVDRLLIQRIEEDNLRRAAIVAKRAVKARYCGLGLFAFVLSTYFYTIYATKQETFLDDLNEPEKIIIEDE